MKKTILLITILALGLNAFSQQIPLHSQYMMDLSTVNPAVAGSYDFTPISLNYRQQWVGFEGAPVTQYFNAHKYMGKNVGLGISLFNELTSPTRRTGMQVSFAYHIPLSEDFSKKLSFGLAPVVFQHYLNASLITTDQPNDPAAESGFNNQFCPDANFGVMFSKNNQYYVGLSVFNLLQIRRDLFQVMDQIENPIERSFYLVGGYQFHVHEDFSIDPSALVQYQINAPFQFDVNLRGVYKNRFGLGVSYRYEDAVVYMAFVSFNNFRVGYSYDMTLSDISMYSFGSNEFHVSYRIPSKSSSVESQTSMPMFY
ncbi:MAG: type IX secretion system membrane protein PorP/SprF [Bacteroidales bacterium]|nr:type IX secretion system membrane protein PorP/SprF [Bacteroidales bacterium]